MTNGQMTIKVAFSEIEIDISEFGATQNFLRNVFIVVIMCI